MLRRWLLYLFPKRVFSVFVGAFSRTPWSRWVIPWYVRTYHLDMDEAEMPIQHYRTLSTLFTRRLRGQARRYDEPGILSPVDGTVTDVGEIDESTSLVVKGCRYSVVDLLTDPFMASALTGGTYVVLYLSPRDYHRIHMPVDGIVTQWIHIPGRLYPVNRWGLESIPGLYAKNERIVSYVETPLGPMAIVKVGAMGVSTVRTAYVRHAKNERRRRRTVSRGVVHAPLHKGQEIGHFELGSTVILLLAKGVANTVLVDAGSVVKAGQPIAQSRSTE